MPTAMSARPTTRPRRPPVFRAVTLLVGVLLTGGLPTGAAHAQGAPATQSADVAEADRLFAAQQWETAAEAYLALAAAAPDDQHAWFRRGFALHALGRYDEALVAHQRAAELPGPAQALADYNAACAHALLGQVEAACAALQRAGAAGAVSVAGLDSDPDLVALADEPAYLALRHALAATTRYRSLRPADTPGDADQFDFWLGDWDTVNFSRSGTGPWVPAGGLETRAHEVLGGRALVEWSRGVGPGSTTQGFSIRTYDAARDEWVVLLNWPSPGKPYFYVLNGRFRHGRCELMSDPSGPGGLSQTRFSFSDAAPDRYRWDSATTADGGDTWRTSLMFEGTRRPADAAPLTTGPSRNHAHCPGDEFRALDALLGEWSGTLTTGVGAALPVRLSCWSAMDGSAVVEEWRVGAADEARETWVIQAYEPGRQAWVRYELDHDSPRFRRYEGAATPAGIDYAGTPGPGSPGAPEALSITVAADGNAHVTRTSKDGAATTAALRPVR